MNHNTVLHTAEHWIAEWVKKPRSQVKHFKRKWFLHFGGLVQIFVSLWDSRLWSGTRGQGYFSLGSIIYSVSFDNYLSGQPAGYICPMQNLSITSLPNCSIFLSFLAVPLLSPYFPPLFFKGGRACLCFPYTEASPAAKVLFCRFCRDYCGLQDLVGLQQRCLHVVLLWSGPHWRRGRHPVHYMDVLPLWSEWELGPHSTPGIVAGSFLPVC